MTRIKPLTLWYALVVVLAAANGARTTAADKAQDSSKIEEVATVEGITEYRLENGMRVLLYPDSSRPKVTVNLTVFVGSRHEGYGETGMAHLLEHMLFKGTPDHPAIPKALRDRGADFNGTTWVDRTNYYETLPAGDENLEFAIRLEADRMVHSHVKREDLLSEMTVVRNEFEMGENSPQRILNQRVMATAYEWHNYGKSTIGNRSDIERVPIENLQAFYRKYYQPDNAMLIVAGTFDPGHALAAIEKYFGTLPKPKRKLDKTYTEEPPQDGERTVTLRRTGDVALVEAAYHIPSGGHPDMAALDILSNILGEGPSARLYKALVESQKATGVAAFVFNGHDPGLFEAEAELRRDDPLEEVRDILLNVTEGVAESGVSDEEVERARRQLLKQREQAEADTSRMAVQLSDWAAQGDWRLYFLYRDRLEKVTADDVKRVAGAYLRRGNRTVGLFLPSRKTDKTPIPESPDLASVLADYKGREATSAGEAFDVTPENIEAHAERTELAGGIKLVLLPKKTKGRIVHLRLVLRYGDLDNLKGLVTACELLPRLMTRGTKDLSRQELADELDRLSATLNAFGETGKATFSIQTKRENLGKVLELARQVWREPSLPEDQFEILKRETLAGLEEQLTDPRSLALTQVRRSVSPYDEDDVRYIPTIAEDLGRAKQVELDQLKTLHSEYLGNAAGEIAVLGDFDADECRELLTKTFDDWQAKREYARLPRLYFKNAKAGRQQIDTPDKENAVYMAGQAMPIDDSDADYPALVIGNYILGGSSLASRLGDRVRQKEGLSYGIASYFAADSLDKRGSVTLMAIFNPANVTQVEKAIREEVDRLLQDGISAEELADATKGYLDEQQVDRANDSFLLQLLTDTAYAGRTMDYYADLEGKIKRLTTKQVNAALGRHFKAQRLAVIVAGDFSAKPGAQTPQAKGDEADGEAAADAPRDDDDNTGNGKAADKKRAAGKKAGR